MKLTKKILSVLTVVVMISLVFANTLTINAAPLAALPALDAETKQLAITHVAHKSGKNNGTNIQGEGFVVKFNKDVKGFMGFFSQIKIDVTCDDPSVVIAPTYTKLISVKDFSVVTGNTVAKNTQSILPKDTYWMYSETKLNSTTTDNFGKLYKIMAANPAATYTLNYSVIVADVETGNTQYNMPIGTSVYTNLDSGGGLAQISYTDGAPVLTYFVPPVVTCDIVSVPVSVENGASFDYKSFFASSECSGLVDSHFLFFLSTDGGVTFEQKTAFDSTLAGKWYIQTSNVTNRVGRGAGQQIEFEVLAAIVTPPITPPVTPPPTEGTSGITYAFEPHDKVYTASPSNTKNLVLQITNADIAHFVSVMVDGVVLDPQHYDVTAGSIVVTLKSSWLNTLAVGSYKISVNIDDGTTLSTVDTVIEIKSPSSVIISPITGGGSGGAFPTTGQTQSGSSTSSTIVGSGSTAAVGTSNPSTGVADSLGASVLFATISLLSGALFVTKKIKK